MPGLGVRVPYSALSEEHPLQRQGSSAPCQHKQSTQSGRDVAGSITDFQSVRAGSTPVVRSVWSHALQLWAIGVKEAHQVYTLRVGVRVPYGLLLTNGIAT